MLLSDKDIKRELIKGKNLMVHPLNINRIKGSSINLTASKHAWKISDGKLAVEGNEIKIPPYETVCIYTEESIWVSNKISGTFHSKVSQVFKGLGHIGTTLDPEWIGLCLVAVSNPSAQTTNIHVGHTFVTLMLYYLKTAATSDKNENQASRLDLSGNFEITQEDRDYITSSWARSKEGLKNKYFSSESYINLTKQKRKRWDRIRTLGQNFGIQTISSVIGAIIGAIVTALIIGK